nr:hypothetical protein [Tanacetum cinerariifolium]
MSMGSALKASSFLTCPGAPLVVSSIGICRTPTVTGQMANSVTLVAFGSAWTIMVIVATRAQRVRSSVRFLLTRPSSSDLKQKCESSYSLAQQTTDILLDLIQFFRKHPSTHQCQFLKTLVIVYHIGTFNLQIPHLNLQLLNLAPWEVLVGRLPFQTEIGELWAADHRRQTQLVEALTLLKRLQSQMAALQSQQRPTRDPTHPDVPEEAGGSS